MKKHLIIIGMTLVLLNVGFSGCTEQEITDNNGDGNKSPNASVSANPTVGNAPLTVYFAGSGSDSDGSITSYYWNFDDGETSTEQNPSHEFQTSGTYTVTFIVADNDDATDTDTIKITVSATLSNNIPICSLSASPTSGDAPLTVTFSMDAEDLDGTISFWELDVDNDGTSEFSDSGESPSGKQYIYTNSGEYTAKFTVFDNESANNYDTIDITVNVPPPEPITLKGSGDDVSSSFTLEEGVAIFDMNHKGSSNFQIWLYNADTGIQEDLLVNEIGSYSGKMIVGVKKGSIVGVEPGRYLLDVTADGSWDVEVEQPNPSTASSLPWTFSGNGADVSSPFLLESGMGAVKYKMHHVGSSNFQIWLFHVSGDYEELLVNEIGNYDGSTLHSVGGILGSEPGIHYLDIEADGNWQVEISYV